MTYSVADMPADCSSSLTPTEQYRIEVKNETDIAGWREEARTLLVNNIPPEQLDWTVRSRANNSQFDFGVAEPPKLSTAAGTSDFRVAKECLRLINTALLHRNEDRFDLAYRLLFRMRHAPKIYQNPADSDGKRLSAYAKSVRRDIHKMHAFVRFRKTGLRENREQFIAWFEPDHHIVEAVGPFFRNRFTGMDWIIVTPEASLSWDGKSLINGPGGCKQDVPTDDAVEQEWSTYYRNIFNPARLKTRAMKSEMPVKYWHNLPETALIPSLIKKSGAMVQQMMEKEEQQLVLGDEATVEHRTKPASLEALNAEMATHTRSISENSAVNAVFGEGHGMPASC
ncbi:TIGR03915 family putative DNA repair protein [Parasphingorhabdus halotolerans]|uniref:DUF4130 domain-containing protein n=1 Tax=Parasphingorhabdus halotolerans TaxID=2725558 RepID=A0A6H2DRA4_9SPHN|nr:TIGR03915 family putative DNA repair protein [Parasphingorhabdus halotolerans]QJB70291.1 DUF4130 domain-containing protein [Parasphingorhabdus halotolerans]